MAKLLNEQQAREVRQMILADRLVRIEFSEGSKKIIVYERVNDRCETADLVVSTEPPLLHEMYSSYEHFLIAYKLSN